MEIKENYIKIVEILEDACFAELQQKGQEEELGIFLGCFGNRIFQDGSPTD